ncbi:MAG: hypothetical protein HQM11_11565 [SAR324 cluster bacterium]|nr:hypothetical protein [SAR324 cluster bacterium]
MKIRCLRIDWYPRRIFRSALPAGAWNLNGLIKILAGLFLFNFMVSAGFCAEIPLETGTEIRGDARWIETSEAQYIKLEIPRVTLNFSGNVTDITRFRLRLAFDSWMSENTGDPSNTVEYAWIERQVTPDFHLRAGKIFIPLGAWENDASALDQYLYSLAVSALPVTYANGLDIRFLAGGQTFALQGFESPYEAHEESAALLAYNLVWYGSFVEGQLLPLVSWGRIPVPRTQTILENITVTTAVHDTIHSGVGLRWTTVRIMLEMEYTRQTFAEYQSETDDSGQISRVRFPEEHIASQVLNFSYHWPETWNWLFKYTHDENQSGDKNHIRQIGVATGWEFFPDETENYRIHTILLRITDYQGASTNIRHEVNLGTSIRFP